MVRYSENRWVFPPVPTARGRKKSEEYFDDLGNREIDVLEVHADCASDFEVQKPKRKRRRYKMIKIENSAGGMGEMFTNLLSEAINISQDLRQMNLVRYMGIWEK